MEDDKEKEVNKRVSPRMAETEQGKQLPERVAEKELNCDEERKLSCKIASVYGRKKPLLIFPLSDCRYGQSEKGNKREQTFIQS